MLLSLDFGLYVLDVNKDSISLVARKSVEHYSPNFKTVLALKMVSSIFLLMLLLVFVLILVTVEKIRSQMTLLAGVVRHLSAYSAMCLKDFSPMDSIKKL